MVRVLIFGETSQDVMRYHLHRFVALHGHIKGICYTKHPNENVRKLAFESDILCDSFPSIYDAFMYFKPDFAIGFPGDPVSLAAVRRAGIPVYDGGCGA